MTVCLTLGAVACDPVSRATAQVQIYTPLAEVGEKATAGTPAGCLHVAGGEVGFIRGDQPLFIRHGLDKGVLAAQPQLTADLTLETVCDRTTAEDIAYAADGQLVKPLRAPPGAECGLVVTLTVANAETRCETPADPERCGPEATPCPTAGSSSSGEGGSGSASTDASESGDATSTGASGTSTATSG